MTLAELRALDVLALPWRRVLYWPRRWQCVLLAVGMAVVAWVFHTVYLAPERQAFAQARQRDAVVQQQQAQERAAAGQRARLQQQVRALEAQLQDRRMSAGTPVGASVLQQLQLLEQQARDDGGWRVAVKQLSDGPHSRLQLQADWPGVVHALRQLSATLVWQELRVRVAQAHQTVHGRQAGSEAPHPQGVQGFEDPQNNVDSLLVSMAWQAQPGVSAPGQSMVGQPLESADAPRALPGVLQRSPFTSLSAWTATSASTPLHSESHQALSAVSPDAGREALRLMRTNGGWANEERRAQALALPLSRMRLLGVVQGAGLTTALVLAGGQTWRVGVGERLGSEGHRVRDIRAQAVLLESGAGLVQQDGAALGGVR